MARNDTITIERVKEVVNYDPKTGVFTWAKNIGKKHRKGQVAGYTSKRDGRVDIGIDGVTYRANRLAYFYMTGKWPVPVCDHVNMDPSDNRWCNLRQATIGQNGANSIRRNRKVLKGAYRSARGDTWFSQITVNGRAKRLGTFATPEEAHLAYCTAAKQIHGEFARTR